MGQWFLFSPVPNFPYSSSRSPNYRPTVYPVPAQARISPLLPGWAGIFPQFSEDFFSRHPPASASLWSPLPNPFLLWPFLYTYISGFSLPYGALSPHDGALLPPWTTPVDEFVCGLRRVLQHIHSNSHVAYVTCDEMRRNLPASVGPWTDTALAPDARYHRSNSRLQ